MQVGAGGTRVGTGMNVSETFLDSSLSSIGKGSLHLSYSVRSVPPTRMADTPIFKMWLGSLSTDQGLSIPVV